MTKTKKQPPGPRHAGPILKEKKSENALMPGIYHVNPGKSGISCFSEIKTGYPYVFRDGKTDNPGLGGASHFVFFG